jgi:anti-anti-sigma factor
MQRMDYIQPDISDKELRLHFLKRDLVFNTSSFILEFVEKLIQSSKAERVVFDLGIVDHIDSSAVGMFISIKNKLQKTGRTMAMEGLSENVLRVLTFLDITDFLELHAA